MSKALKGEEAYNSGLVDAIVPPNELVNTARQWALDIVDRRRPWVASLYKTDKIEPLGEAREILKFARAQTQKRAPNLTHPLVCIDVIEEGIISGPRAGLFKVLICPILFFSTSLKKAVIFCCLMLSDIGRKLKLSKHFRILTLPRVWSTSSSLNVERQRFEHKPFIS